MEFEELTKASQTANLLASDLREALKRDIPEAERMLCEMWLEAAVRLEMEIGRIVYGVDDGQ